MEIPLVEKENVILEAFNAHAVVSIEMHTGIIQDLPQPPTTQAGMMLSLFWKTFKCSQSIKLKVVFRFDVGSFATVPELLIMMKQLP